MGEDANSGYLTQTEVTRLVAATLDGDVDAFDHLIQAHQGRLWAYLSRSLLPRAELEDLAQETLLAAYESLADFDCNKPFGFWLCGIARFRVLSHVRDRACAARNLSCFKLELERQWDADEQRETTDPRLEALAACRDQLDGDARKVVILRYDRGMEYQTIAQELGRTLDATRRLLSRVRARLRDCVDNKQVTA